MNVYPKTNYISEYPASMFDAWFKYDGLAVPFLPTIYKVKRELFAYPVIGYVVPMEKKPNRFVNKLKTFKMHLLNHLDEYNLQMGFPYYIMEDFPRLCLNMVQILNELKLIVGYDIDERGFVTYDEEGI